MNDEFENALAWFCSAPSAWVDSAKKDLAACAEWIWEVLQGDFNDNASTAQVVTGTVISMIPFVDQLCDVRDVVANCKNIKKEPAESWHWISLVLTLIGLFPTLGSFAKVLGKIICSSLRSAGKASGKAMQLEKLVEASILQLTKFLARPEIVKTLIALKIDNPYKYLSNEIRKIAKKLNSNSLVMALNDACEATSSLLKLVEKFGSAGLASKANSALESVESVRRNASRNLATAVKPVRDLLNRVARRLEIEADMMHRAQLNVINPHGFQRLSRDGEAEAFNKSKPVWVDKAVGPKYDPMLDAPVSAGWPVTTHDPKRGHHPLDDAYKTFHTMEPRTIPPGTRLFRIIDPRSADNSICWMSETEFRELKSKDQWRRRFAVWANWNSNGEFVTYTVPPGPGLRVWEGKAASQEMQGTSYVLEGGATQVVLNPDDLLQSHMGTRQKTGWGYDDIERTPSMLGVPVQKNNWHAKEGV